MDPITTISGPVDANAFIDNTSIASGEDTLAEVVQVINKVNEVIGGLTVVASDLDSAELDIASESASRASADSGLSDDIAQVDAVVATHTSDIADHTSRIQSLEATAASYGTVATITASATPSITEIRGYRVLVCQKADATTVITVELPATPGDELNACPPITIINDGFTTVQLSIEAGGYWGNGTTTTETFIILGNNEYATLIPLPSPAIQDLAIYHLIGGKTYADIAS